MKIGSLNQKKNFNWLNQNVMELEEKNYLILKCNESKRKVELIKPLHNRKKNKILI